MLDQQRIDRLPHALHRSMLERSPVAPVPETGPEMKVDDLCRIGRRVLELRVAAGERSVGKQIGATSGAIQRTAGRNYFNLLNLLYLFADKLARKNDSDTWAPEPPDLAGMLARRACTLLPWTPARALKVPE